MIVLEPYKISPGLSLPAISQVLLSSIWRRIVLVLLSRWSSHAPRGDVFQASNLIAL